MGRQAGRQAGAGDVIATILGVTCHLQVFSSILLYSRGVAGSTHEHAHYKSTYSTLIHFTQVVGIRARHDRDKNADRERQGTEHGLLQQMELSQQQQQQQEQKQHESKALQGLYLEDVKKSNSQLLDYSSDILRSTTTAAIIDT